MKRRKFILNTGIATAGAFLAPYILPAGRLFAATGSRIVNHVVLVLLGGGIRNEESIGQGYLTAQGKPYVGNVMPNILSGSTPNAEHLIYEQWQPVTSVPLQLQGTLYRELRYASGAIHHHNVLMAALTGNYPNDEANTLNIFEHYRKYNNNASAINCWYVGEDMEQITGANHLRPSHTFGTNIKHPTDNIPGISSNEEDKYVAEQFIQDTHIASQNGNIKWPLPAGIHPSEELTSDLNNIAYSWQVLNKLAPELMVVSINDADVCHSNFTGYLQAMHKADYGIGWLWNKIQTHPVLANDTILFCMTDHGRNSQPNNITDANGLRGFDHTGDDSARRSFALIVGPENKVKHSQVIGGTSNPAGETIDIAPTIAHILGFESRIRAGLLPGVALKEAFI